ncbi:MAG: ABC transporter permease [Thermoplasmatota archaeon]
MNSNELQSIYVMWLRHMKRFLRSKSRLISTIAQPLFFLFILGSGFQAASFKGLDVDYLSFLAPGIISMSILFSSMFTGVSVLWDKQFGFLQEVLVAPVSRFSIIFGRTLGGATTALIQGFIILGIALALGVRIVGVINLLFTLIFMLLIAFTAVGFGLTVATKIGDFEGFQIIMNLLLMPLIFLSSAFFPVNTQPVLQTIALFNPIFYMVDGLRGSLLGTASIYPVIIDFFIVLIICLIMLSIGSYSFHRSEA